MSTPPRAAAKPPNGRRGQQPFRKTRIAAASSLGLLSFVLNPLVVGGAIGLAALLGRTGRRDR